MKNELNFLEELFQTIEKKSRSKDNKSYTKQLLKKGKNAIAQKVGEESSELIIDYLNGSKKRTIEEASDLIYHLLVMWKKFDLSPDEIYSELEKREGKTGIRK